MINSDENSLKTRARARPHTRTHKRIHTAGCIKTRDPERDEEITIPLDLNCNRNFIFQAVIEIQNFQYLEAQALHSIHSIIRDFSLETIVVLFTPNTTFI